MKQKFVRLWARVPVPVKREGKHVALTFAAAFVATVRAGLPSVVHSPSVSVAKALVVASAAAGVKAAYPVAEAAVKKSRAKVIAWAVARVTKAAS